MGVYGAHGYFRKVYARTKLEVGTATTKASGINATTSLISIRGISYGVQTITSTASTVSGDQGVTFCGITGATADKVLNLARPAGAGVQKQIICTSTGAQQLSLTINGSTLTSFFLNTKPNKAGGSTFRTIVFSSNSTKQRSVLLVGQNSTTWAVVFSSTGVTFAG